MNQPINQDFDVGLDVSFVNSLQIESWLETAEQFNIELLKQKSNSQINAYDIKINQSGYLPTVGLIGHMDGILIKVQLQLFSQGQTTLLIL